MYRWNWGAAIMAGLFMIAYYVMLAAGILN